MKAIWNDTVIADSDKTVVLEGNHYFPVSSLNRQYVRDSDTRTVCPWKGTASYYDVVVGDRTNTDAAWHYPAPSDAASSIRGHVAFWRGVEIAD